MKAATLTVVCPLFVACSLCTLAAGQTRQEPPASLSPAHQRLAEELPRLPAKSPAQALETFRILGGFRMELVAEEPLVTDPVAVKYDENGLAYVAEMADYPYSDKSHDRPHAEQTSLPLGRVRVLEDTDGDGRFDKSTILADRLSWPTGLALWKGGVFVTCTPDIVYLKDLDGDRKADVHRTVFTGFHKFNVQSVINNLRWSLDHKIYASGSSNGGEIRRAADANSPPIRMRRSDFRFDAATESFELVTGGARFGNTFDDWGNRFVCDIRNPVQHIVLENRYLTRNTSLAVRSGLNDCAESGDKVAVFRASPPEPWRVINSQRLASDPDGTSPNSEKVAAGFLTSSSGITVYRGAAYPEEFYGNIFVGDVAGNVTLRYVMTPDGPSFRATRVHGKYEFLASTDNWFRPVNYVNAPDGTLHIVDMYRETIEHPWSIPDDIKAHLDLVSGRDRGRIYRLVPPTYREGFKAPPRPQLGIATIDELVAELENPNAWWRETAHRLLFERQDSRAVTPLRRMLRESDRPAARLGALWSLVGLESLAAPDIEIALTDRSPHVRRHAVRLAESRIKDAPALLVAVLRAAADPDPRVRFQVAFTLGEVQDERTVPALAGIARRDGENPWTRAAVLSSLAGNSAELLVDILSDRSFAASASGRAMIRQLATTVGAGESDEGVVSVLSAVAADEVSTAAQRKVQSEFCLAIGAGLRRSDRNLRQFAAADTAAGKMIARLLAESRQIAADGGSEQQRRVEAIALLGHDSFELASKALTPLLDPREGQEIQSLTIETLSGFRNPAVTEALLGSYSRLTPGIRKQVVQAMLARYDRLPALLEAVSQRKVSATLISGSQRRRILASQDETLVKVAREMFGNDASSPRGEVISQYQRALALTPDIKRGEAIFRVECLNCHRVGNEGHDVGPSLTTVRHRSPANVMVHILDPNREVSPNYLEYVLVTVDGRVVTGAIAAETATSITLRSAESKEFTILRQDIETIASSGKSLMPEGIEKKITPQQMADLLAFVLQSGGL